MIPAPSKALILVFTRYASINHQLWAVKHNCSLPGSLSVSRGGRSDPNMSLRA